MFFNLSNFMKKIILASKSPYRKELLNRLSLKFECLPSHINEDILKSQISDPALLSLKLAEAKALKIYENYSNSIIIGSDQICWFEGRSLSKTGSIADSKEELRILQGKEHTLFTSYVIIYGDNKFVHTNTTVLKMKSLSEAQIIKYLDLDNPIDCAGSYKLECHGIGLFDAIETEDHTAIIGLPLLQLSKDLEKLGINIP